MKSSVFSPLAPIVDRRINRRTAAVFAIELFIATFFGLPGRAQVSTPPDGRYATVNGMRMYYEAYGSGSPLLLLHGFKGSGKLWSAFIPELAKSYRLIVPDLRGHGRSTNPAKVFTHRQAARDIQAFLSQLGISRCRAMGLSSGAIIFLHIATQQPHRIEAMVLVSATTYFPDEARELMRKSTLANMTEQEWQGARRIHVLGDDQIRLLRQQFHQFKDSYDDVNFTPPALGKITAPTLIVHGDRDPFFPVSIALDMYQAIPNAYLWVIPNGVHVPVYQQAGDFTRTSLEFFKSQDTK